MGLVDLRNGVRFHLRRCGAVRRKRWDTVHGVGLSGRVESTIHLAAIRTGPQYVPSDAESSENSCRHLQCKSPAPIAVIPKLNALYRYTKRPSTSSFRCFIADAKASL
jgi:hypothetical protein